MSQTTQALESAALLLPPEERARLAERLLASLDIDPEIEEAWAAEVEKRLADWEAGRVKEYTLDEVREHIESRLSTK
jgi:putative addiction module component (TIGR02574 family)